MQKRIIYYGLVMGMIMGGIFLLVLAIEIYRYSTLGVQTQGIVVNSGENIRFQQVNNLKVGITTYQPQIEFRTEAGQKYCITPKNPSVEKLYHKGERVDIVYLPQSPELCKTYENIADLWYNFLIVFIINIIFFVGAASFYKKMPKS